MPTPDYLSATDNDNDNEALPSGDVLVDLRQHLTWKQVQQIFPDVNPSTLRSRAHEYLKREKALFESESAIIDLPPGGNVLVIPDSHLPFEIMGGLNFLQRVRDKWKCDWVIHIGDLVDNHAMSDYSPDPDGFSPGVEMEKAWETLYIWFKAFPEVYGVLGNHDLRPRRKAKQFGLSKHVMQSFRQMWNLPRGWQWSVGIKKDDILYVHGTGAGGKTPSLNRAEKKMKSIVSGHIHTAGGVWYAQGDDRRIFGLNTGCLVDGNSYAMAYGGDSAKGMILGCGVVLDGGTLPMFIPYPDL